MRRLRFWCTVCGFKTWQTLHPDRQTTGKGLWWQCDRCDGWHERSAYQAESGERE